MVDSTDETYNIKQIFMSKLEKKTFKVFNLSDVIDYIFIYSTLITTLQCQKYSNRKVPSDQTIFRFTEFQNRGIRPKFLKGDVTYA